jgi:hypothetical protein
VAANSAAGQLYRGKQPGGIGTTTNNNEMKIKTKKTSKAKKGRSLFDQD